jgi:hypothetical protein
MLTRIAAYFSDIASDSVIITSGSVKKKKTGRLLSAFQTQNRFLRLQMGQKEHSYAPALFYFAEDPQCIEHAQPKGVLYLDSSEVVITISKKDKELSICKGSQAAKASASTSGSGDPHVISDLLVEFGTEAELDKWDMALKRAMKSAAIQSTRPDPLPPLSDEQNADLCMGDILRVQTHISGDASFHRKKNECAYLFSSGVDNFGTVRVFPLLPNPLTPPIQPTQLRRDATFSRLRPSAQRAPVAATCPSLTARQI